MMGLEDLRQPVALIKSLVSEMMGTMLLIIIGCGAPCSLHQAIVSYAPANGTLYSFAPACSTLVLGSSFAIATVGIVYYTRHISGGNSNVRINKITKENKVCVSTH